MFTADSLAESCDDSNTEIATATGVLLAISVIGLVISLTVNVIQYIQRKKARLY